MKTLGSKPPPHLRLIVNPQDAMWQAKEAVPSSGTRPNVDWSFLMAQAQNGERVAYRKLLCAVTPYIRALARRSFRNTSDAEDAVQDVLLALHVLRATYDPKRPFGPWLKSIANHKIIDRQRMLMRQRKREAQLEQDFMAPDERGDDNRDSKHQPHLAPLLEHLPPREAEALRLTKLRGMTLEQASMESGQSTSALRVATHRALKRLRSILGRENDNAD